MVESYLPTKFGINSLDGFLDKPGDTAIDLLMVKRS